MHTTMAHSHLRLCSEPLQEDFATDLQKSRKICNNNQQRRGRRRTWRGPDVGQIVGMHGSISLAILVLTTCMAHTSTAVTAIENSNSSTSSTVVMVAVTPSIAAPGSSIGSGAITSRSSSTTTEAPPEQQQPQGQCLLDGLWVAETTVHCEKHTSCRAIQRTGHCCPDYKCDCEKDGKTYANGYKLVDPDTPCTVCYCKGGEIVCSSVTCFRRDDCMPKYVPGRCCPEYDNCPILDNNPPLSSETSSTTTSTQKPAFVAQSSGFNWNITIKEITKPSEIRITDDNKAKPAVPTRKSIGTGPVLTTEGAPPSAATATSVASTTVTSTAATAAATTTTAATTQAAEASSTTTEATYPPTPTTVVISTDAATTPTTLRELVSLSQDTTPKALPGTSSSGSLKLAASVGYIERPHAQSGNDVEQNIKPLVSSNADGLLPLAQHDPSKISFKREFTTERASPSTQGYAESGAHRADSVFIQNGFGDAFAEIPDGELEPDTAGSDNIYHIISTTEGPSSGISASTDSNSPLSSGTIVITGQNSTSAKPEVEMSTEGPGSSSEMTPMSSTQHMDADEDVPQVESNPAYPSLPEDDFSLRDVNFPLVDLEDAVDSYTKDEPRSIPSPFEVDKKPTKVVQESTVDGSGSGSGSGDMEPYLEGSSTANHGRSSPSSKKNSSMVPLLMYSAEDNSGETRIQNASDLQLENIGRRQIESETSEELDALGGSRGEIKEPTTPRPTPITALDIDELGSGAGQLQISGGVDPKSDAESLKLDESQETIAKTTSEDKSSARAEKSLVERALPLGRLYLQRIF